LPETHNAIASNKQIHGTLAQYLILPVFVRLCLNNCEQYYRTIMPTDDPLVNI
jgi:hypothetical protein